MEQTVYVDLLFLINFSMDFLCLYLTSRLLSRRLSLPRAIVAAAVGGVYAVFELLFSAQNALGFFLNVSVCLLICLIAFLSKGEKPLSLILLSASYILSSALLGGLMTACFSLLNRFAPPLFSENNDMPVWIFCLITVLSTLATLFGGKHLRKRASTARTTVEVFLLGRSVRLDAMCDSGNLLKDAISGKSVLLADRNASAPLFPQTYPLAKEWDVETIAHLPSPLARRICLIPTSSVGGDRILLAIRPDKLLLHDQNGSHSIDALVGFAEINGALHDCNALIPPELLM